MKREKIFIADDSEMNRSILAYMLDDSYEIIEEEDGVQATAILSETSPFQVERAYELGDTDFIVRPFDALIV